MRFFDAQATGEARKALASGHVDRDTLAVAYLPVGIDVVRRMARNLGVREAIPDWVQEAAIAILQAAEFYLRDRPDVPFPKYAAGAVYRRLRRIWLQSLPVYMPEHIGGAVLTFNRLVDDALRVGRTPTDDELAHDMGIPKKRVRELWRAREILEAPPRRLDDPVPGLEDVTVGDCLADPDVDVEAEALAAVVQEERRELWEAARSLKQEDRVALGLNLGAPLFEDATVAEVYALSQGVNGISRQSNARGRLAKLFREGMRDARRLGFLPEDATGRPGARCKLTRGVSGRRRNPAGPGRGHRRHEWDGDSGIPRPAPALEPA